jgi:MFS family permease
MTAIATTGAAFLLAGVAGKQYDRRGARITLSIAMASALLGSVILGMGFGQESLLFIIIALLFIGVGIAFANTSNTEALNFAPQNLRGTTSALFNTLGQFGNSFSVAILTSLIVVAESRQLSTALGSFGANPEQINQAQLIMAEASQGNVSRLSAIPAAQSVPGDRPVGQRRSTAKHRILGSRSYAGAFTAGSCHPEAFRRKERTKNRRYQGSEIMTWQGETFKGNGEIEKTVPFGWPLTGDGLCCGFDSETPVSDQYSSPFRFTGKIDRVIVSVSGKPYQNTVKEIERAFLIE